MTDADQHLSQGEWRKRVGIEPTAAGVSLQPDGFEGRASHQTRIASGREDSDSNRRARSDGCHGVARLATEVPPRVSPTAANGRPLGAMTSACRPALQG